MPKVQIQGKQINYEVHGIGTPLVLLNGIMMSTASWKPFIEVFGAHHQLILMDFIDQGQSDPGEGDYPQELQVTMVKGLLDFLKLKQVHLVGVSYGGEVAQRFALAHQERLLSLVLANTTSHTTPILEDIGRGWIEAAKTKDASTFFKATMPYIYSAEFYQRNFQWLKAREKAFGTVLTPQWYQGFIRLVRSAEGLNLTEALGAITVPTLIIGAEYDTITPIRVQETLQEKIPHARFLGIKGAGHASMYEKPGEFAAAVLGFLATLQFPIQIGYEGN